MLNLIFIFIIIVWTLALINAFLSWRFSPILKPDLYESLPLGPPLVTAVIPARNEESSVEKCVRSLLGQDYPKFEVVVVDDCSTDKTPLILERLQRENPKLKVVSGAEPPEGWLGKPYAFYEGMQVAKGDWLLFADADVIFHPQAVTQAISYALKHSLDMLVLAPYFVLLTFWERVLMPGLFVVGTGFFPMWLVKNPQFKSVALGSGTFNLVRRQAYEKVGGHQALKSEIIDDVELGRLVKSKGYCLEAGGGFSLVKVRMYSGLREIVDGFTKNFFAIFKGGLPESLLFIISIFIISVFPFLAVPVLGLNFIWSGKVSLFTVALALGACATILAFRLFVDGVVFKCKLLYVLTHPLGALIFMGIELRSAFFHWFKKEIVWRGRTYKLNRKTK